MIQGKPFLRKGGRIMLPSLPCHETSSQRKLVLDFSLNRCGKKLNRNQKEHKGAIKFKDEDWWSKWDELRNKRKRAETWEMIYLNTSWPLHKFSTITLPVLALSLRNNLWPHLVSGRKGIKSYSPYVEVVKMMTASETWSGKSEQIHIWGGRSEKKLFPSFLEHELSLFTPPKLLFHFLRVS